MDKGLLVVETADLEMWQVSSACSGQIAVGISGDSGFRVLVTGATRACCGQQWHGLLLPGCAQGPERGWDTPC